MPSKLYSFYSKIMNTYGMELFFLVATISCYKMTRDDLDNPSIHFDMYFMPKMISFLICLCAFIFYVSIDIYIIIKARSIQN